LTAATEAAIRDDVFVPTFDVDGELFWGEDRIDALLWQLQGNRIDESLLTDVLAGRRRRRARPAEPVLLYGQNVTGVRRGLLAGPA
jgi:hypothetical protein